MAEIPSIAEQIAERRRQHSDQHPPGFYEKVLDWLNDPDHEVRREAVLYLARHLRSREEAGVIVDLLDSDPNVEVRKAAAECVGGVFRATRNRGVLEVLARVSKDSDEDGQVRAAAYQAIKKINAY
jgi:HEAT repeat protein